ncbi:hypothetical protein CEXT_519691 [Caerostris extrusa]|uniref:Uncharacterized protein n=1 Tax=Caerostris extrusa TaxID=172846 RepID=A0AAV4R6I3_CAEEX|nr:hypothetical protein CEXT_519691 [Caerostris extrusa]
MDVSAIDIDLLLKNSMLTNSWILMAGSSKWKYCLYLIFRIEMNKQKMNRFDEFSSMNRIKGNDGISGYCMLDGGWNRDIVLRIRMRKQNLGRFDGDYCK